MTAASDSRRCENERLLALLDRVYGADGGEEEAELSRRWRPLYRRVLREDDGGEADRPHERPEATS